MTVITPEAKAVLDDNLAIQATVNPDGTPDIGPKGSLRSYDDTHIIYNERTARQTLKNIENGSKIIVVAIDLAKHSGYRFFGTPHLFGEGTPEFANAEQWAAGNGQKAPKYAVLIDVERVDKL
ncbi:pyridoxamine 5'-phosphate oxidase family protein [Pseudoclavibacter caeni]|jgi:uncharacterized protein|uniref:Pyridoxamine 5'-phosphate oxidase family protein n=1 Tax=Pseudoclavibacter caeni TaxID=908846 RepID=A0A7C8BNB8_9MICO|nr:pyridoxamine 5'-phosphate oxidase family protein [Pseudoclavibacter caeni]KAB1632367.1 pyridoxamine 5'-phosphate oxidase family protein [Pseudoclavibacter caeni]NYJ97611.1 hypothetical protein [Pseudoclavibacter caeni]